MCCEEKWLYRCHSSMNHNSRGDSWKSSIFLRTPEVQSIIYVFQLQSSQFNTWFTKKCVHVLTQFPWPVGHPADFGIIYERITKLMMNKVQRLVRSFYRSEPALTSELPQERDSWSNPDSRNGDETDSQGSYSPQTRAIEADTCRLPFMFCAMESNIGKVRITTVTHLHLRPCFFNSW